MGDRRLAASLLLFGIAACAPPSKPSGHLREYQISLAVRADGTMAVDEVARVDSAGPVEVRLSIPRWRVDAIRNHRVTIDGNPVGAEGDVAAEPGGGVVWRAAGGGEREIHHSYEAIGVLGFRGARGELIWPAAPPDAAIDRVRVTVGWPADSVPSVAPAVEPGAWRAIPGEHAMTFVREGLRHGEDPWLYLDLVLADLTGAEPAWQITERRGRYLVPAFLSAGLFMVVVGAGILLMIRARYRRGAEGVTDAERSAIRRGLQWSAVAVIAAAAILAVIVPAVASGLGWAPYAVPAGTAMLGLLLAAGSATLP